MKNSALIMVLEDAKKLLALPDNDYLWSSWENAEGALKEIDELIKSAESSQKIDILALEVIFAPTGTMQEASLSSGWAESFLKLAERFDEAINVYK